MFIRPINPYFSINKQPTKHVGPFVQQKNTILAQDAICFTGKKDLLRLPKEKILQEIKNSINDKNKIGQGAEAVVYKIKGTDYCIKKPFNTNTIDTEISLNLTIEDKINHVVAKLGNGSKIMKIIKGFPVAKDKESPKSLVRTENLIEIFPVESYNKLIKQITYAYKNEMIFDHHWTNVIVDSQKQTFTAIDFYPMDTFDHPEICSLHPLRSIFASVMNIAASDMQMQICTKKLLKAGLEELVPNYKPHIKPEEFDFRVFLEWLKDNQKINLMSEDLDILIKSCEKIAELKIQELNGKAVKRNLAKEISITNEIIDKIL